MTGRMDHITTDVERTRQDAQRNALRRHVVGASEGAGGQREFTALLIESTLAAPNRWTYTMSAVVTPKASAGPGYERVDSEDDFYSFMVRNRTEDNNGSTGMLGNGLTVEELQAADLELELRPAPNDFPYTIKSESIADGTTQYYFEHPNGVGGTCPVQGETNRNIINSGA